jgi:nucleotide-binding universal stress UspA family protein
MKRILVGTDGSRPSLEALRWAAALAKRADLELVAAWAWLPGAIELDPHGSGALLAAAERGLGAWCAAARPTVAPRLVLAQGDAAPALLALAREEEADLLVAGPRGRGGLAGLSIGSVAHDLAHHTTLPLALVPPETAARPVGHIALGIDGSAGSLAAARYCADLASSLDVPVTAVLACDPLLEWVPTHDRHGWRRHAEQKVEQWIAPLRAAGVDVEVVVDRDIHPVAALRRAVQAEAGTGSIVVLGGRPLGVIGRRSSRLPLQLVRQADVPVVIVPAEYAAVSTGGGR